MNILFIENAFWIISFSGLILSVFSLIISRIFQEKEIPFNLKPILLSIGVVVFFVSLAALKTVNDQTTVMLDEKIEKKKTVEIGPDASYDEVVADKETRKENYPISKKEDFDEDTVKKLHSLNAFTSVDGNTYHFNMSDSLTHKATITGINISNRVISIPYRVIYGKGFVYVDAISLNISGKDIERIEIPSVVKNIEINIIHCDNLNEIKFSEKNAKGFCSINLRIESCYSLKNISLPKNQSRIKLFVVKECPLLDTVEIPGDTTIDERAIIFQPGSQKQVQIISEDPSIIEKFN